MAAKRMRPAGGRAGGGGGARDGGGRVRRRRGGARAARGRRGPQQQRGWQRRQGAAGWRRRTQRERVGRRRGGARAARRRWGPAATARLAAAAGRGGVAQPNTTSERARSQGSKVRGPGARAPAAAPASARDAAVTAGARALEARRGARAWRSSDAGGARGALDTAAVGVKKQRCPRAAELRERGLLCGQRWPRGLRTWVVCCARRRARPPRARQPSVGPEQRKCTPRALPRQSSPLSTMPMLPGVNAAPLPPLLPPAAAGCGCGGNCVSTAAAARRPIFERARGSHDGATTRRSATDAPALRKLASLPWAREGRRLRLGGSAGCGRRPAAPDSEPGGRPGRRPTCSEGGRDKRRRPPSGSNRRPLG